MCRKDFPIGAEIVGAAKDLGRNSVGIELNPEYLEITKEKVGIDKPDMLDESKFELI